MAISSAIPATMKRVIMSGVTVKASSGRFSFECSGYAFGRIEPGATSRLAIVAFCTRVAVLVGLVCFRVSGNKRQGGAASSTDGGLERTRKSLI
ncbi:hypothetical protein D3C75_1027570 [compost metagenome]